MTKKYIPLVLALLFCLCFCKKNKTTEPDEEANPFDKQALLQNMADNVILPNYVAFSTSLDSLILNYNSFKTNASLIDFQTVKQNLTLNLFKTEHFCSGCNVPLCYNCCSK